MGKVYESDIDPDEFIRDFRESPSQTQPSKKPKVTSSDKDSSAKQKSKPDTPPQSHPQTEEEYLDCFVRNMAHMRSRKKYQVVEVDPIFIQKVKRIISYGDTPCCSAKAYINNVLAEHFREYETYIEKRQ
ncbi:uncharacterized protein BN456_00513 [Prevotella sp. CAG:1031]|nr:uncharacterized protein BN456_00513 [Prevotella sp. CAG:1031]